MKKKKILFITPSIEEKTRGIGIILRNLIYSAHDEGHVCGLIMGLPYYKEKTVLLNSPDSRVQFFIKNYLKNGRESFKYILHNGITRKSIIKNILSFDIFRPQEYVIKQDAGIDKNTLQEKLDFIIQSPFFYQFLGANYKYISRYIISRIVKKYNIDLVVSASPTILRSRDVAPAKLMQFIHDIMPLEIHETPGGGRVKRQFKKTIHTVMRASDAVLTNSNDTAEKIRKLKHKTNIHVLYGSSLFNKSAYQDLRYLLNYYHLKEKNYLLFVSSLEKRKNIINLMSAYEKVVDQINMPLVLVGQPGYGYEEIMMFYEQLSYEAKKGIIMTGHVSEEEKKALYQYAYAFVFPSFYEGLGLSIIEAMEYNLPVITSKKGGLVEVGGDAALFIDDPYNISEIADKLSLLCQNAELRETMVAKGRELVKKFSYEKFKERFIEAVSEL